MRSKIIPILLACAGAGAAHAQFNPIALTPGSYTYDIVVPATYAPGLPYCINVTAGSGSSLGDNTYYEQGLRPVDSSGLGGNSGIPKHNTVFTNINNANMTFLMPPDYTTNNEIMIDEVYTTGTFQFNSPTTASSLAILGCGGGGAITINYTVTHADNSTETGTLSWLDWFSGGSTVAWGANGRITSGGGYNNYNSSKVNNNAPYLYANTISVSSASPVVSIEFDSPSDGNHANLFAVSGSTGAAYTPIPVGGFTVQGIVPAATPQFPVTATMDQGTNFAYNDNMATWFEQGYVRTVPSAGLPPSGTTFTSLTQPSHTYQMGNYYSGNNAILIDTNHQVVNVTPASPAPYTSIAFLTAGGNVGGTPMTNIAVLQHADGVQETNIFLGFDWFDNNHNGAIALKVGGRVNMNARGVNQVNNNYPYLFETYFLLADSGSPVTNIVVKYGAAKVNSPSATTYIMAVSASAGGVAPVVTSGPLPASQTLLPGGTATFAVGVAGTAPVTGYWEALINGSYVPLTDGIDANGSTISGSHTYTLTITNLEVADSTSYEFVANNNFGSDTSAAATLTVNPQTISITPANPAFYTGNNVPLTVVLAGGPPVSLQWYEIDNSGNSNNIAGATNYIYTINNVQTSQSGYTFGVNAYNAYGTNNASVTLNISDSSAFLLSDIAPLFAEAYAGAPVTYTVNVAGNSPISYNWIVNGTVVSGANSNSYTLITPCGVSTIQVTFSNLLSGGASTASALATLQGDAAPTNISFNGNGIGWQTNGTSPILTNNVLQLTDGAGGESSSAFYTNAQYIGGAWTASYIYNSHGGGADGTAFVLQTTNTTAVGGGGGTLGYGGIAGGTLAFEINLYGGNNETPGIDIATNGGTGIYGAAGPVSTTTTNDIYVTLNWANGVLTASLTDPVDGTAYTTNKAIGSLVSLLGSSVAYVGFTGADGGVASTQTVRNFQFHSILPPVSLSVSPLTGQAFVLSWPSADPTYQLQTTSALGSANWVAGPTPTTVGGTNQVTVNVGSSSQTFYRLVRVACH